MASFFFFGGFLLISSFTLNMTTWVRLIQVGIEAWKSARDSTGSTPEDYARLRGHYSYIHLVQRKINKRSAAGHVVVEIPSVLSECSANQKQNDELTSSFEIGRAGLRRNQQQCRVCDKKLAYEIGRAHV